MKGFKILYTIWSVWWLAVWFIFCYPLLFIGALHPKLHFLTHFMNKVWGVLVYGSCFLFINVKGKKYKEGPAIYCVNHTSFMDIPTLFLTAPGFFTIIGKAELNNVPLFGFYFSRVYITVDRKKSQSRYQAYQDCLDSVDKGRSVVFFPEGTIPRDNPPEMIKFKDGPFKTAIEKQVPIIPVTLPYNWIIFPGANGSKLAQWKRPVAVFHDPISTEGMSVNEDLEPLKKQTFKIIDQELKKYNS